MYTTQELHIQLDILLQKVNSNWNKDFLPQEKDFFINREILKFIKQRINPLSNNKKQSAFDTIQRVQNLNSLINTASLNINNINQKEAIVQLPFNFLSYISSELDTYLICSEDNIQTENSNEYYQYIQPIKDVNNISRVFIQLTYNLTSITPTVKVLCDTASFPSNYFPQDGIESYKKAFIYNNAIISQILDDLPNNFECTYNNKTEQFEFRGNEPFSLLYVTYNSVATPAVQTVVTFNKVLSIYNLETTLNSDIRIIDEEFKTIVKKSKLSSSKEDSIVGLLRDDKIVLTKNKNAVHTKCGLTYYKKPRQIDLLLGINSDLPKEVLDEVISNTAQTLKAVISSDTYDKFVQDNLLIE